MDHRIIVAFILIILIIIYRRYDDFMVEGYNIDFPELSFNPDQLQKTQEEIDYEESNLLSGLEVLKKEQEATKLATQKSIINAHNKMRAESNPIIWDDTLETEAKLLVNTPLNIINIKSTLSSREPDKCHISSSLNQPNANIFQETTQMLNPDEIISTAINKWKGTNNLRDSKKVGCAFKQCENGETVMYCLYNNND